MNNLVNEHIPKSDEFDCSAIMFEGYATYLQLADNVLEALE